MRDWLEPTHLRNGDLVRFVSPASTPEKVSVLAKARQFSHEGFAVDFGVHTFDRWGPFAGKDSERLADLDGAFCDRAVRAVFATRGGKGSYRIADQLDFEAIRTDPKWLLGFSDITALHLARYRHCRIPGIHGALYVDRNVLHRTNCDLVMRYLTQHGTAQFAADGDAATARLTTSGYAEGPMIGGNLDTVATTAGWALPDLGGAILLVEAVDCQPGRIDRCLTLLRKAGHLDGLAGIVVGQFLTAVPGQLPRILDLVDEHFTALGVPVLGGLPFGHGKGALSVPVGTHASMDAATGLLTVQY